MFNITAFAEELVKIATLEGRINVQGLDVSIENRKGSVRSGTDPDGNEWHTKMIHPYGYILGSKGEDGEHLDAFIGPDKDSQVVTVIRIKDPKTGKSDEDKVFLGFADEAAAISSFNKHYDDPGKFFESANTMSMDEFKDKLSGPYNKKIKLSALNADVTLRPHQQEAIKLVEEQKGRALLAHGTGTGKTLSAIAAFENLKDKGKANRALVLTPASLQPNFIDSGVKKFTDSSVGPVGSKSTYQVMSLETFRKKPDYYLQKSKADTLIIDEIHRAKDKSTSTSRALRSSTNKVDNVIGLTGSFISNHPREVVPLLDIIKPGHELKSPQAFSRRYTTHESQSGGFLRGPKNKIILQRRPELGGKLQGALHYISHEELGGDLPKMDVQDVHVPMTKEQNQLYQYALGRLPAHQRALIRSGLPANQSEAAHIFAAIMKARQASNSLATHKEMPLHESAEHTPKLRKVMDDVQTHLEKHPEGQAVLYSNLVRGGAAELYAGFKERGIEPGVYAGQGALEGVSTKSRQQDLKEFLKGKKKVMILTPAGGEGVSLNNATFFGEVDRHYNPERNSQAIARARRFGGQLQRKPEDRVLEVRRYYSDPTPPLWYSTIRGREVGVDEWIGRVASEKDRLNTDMRSVVDRRKK